MAMDRLGRLVEEATRQTGRSDFAIMAGLRFDIRGLGSIGELMRHSTTVGEALRSLVLHLHLHDRGAVPVLQRLDARTTLLGYAVHRAAVPALDLAYDVSTGIVYRIMLTLCVPDFRATAIRVSARSQSRAAHYRKHFGCPVRFDAGAPGVVFASRWMEHPVAGADPQRRHLLQRQFAEAEARSPITFGQRVEVVMLQMLLAGNAAAPAVAELFGLSERSLRRRLDAEGRNLRELLRRARFEQARQMLQYTELPVGEIASALQYRDANAFSRAFRSCAGCTATQWRDRCRS